MKPSTTDLIFDMHPPTTDAIAAHTEIPTDPSEYAFACWHPQWGGYSGKCVVYFDRLTNDGDDGNGCFAATNWHDGVFPSDDAEPTTYHYCNASQLIRFGVLILEQQQAHQKRPDGGPVLMPRAQLLELQGRIDALLEVDPGAPSESQVTP